jgi:hypothetical protein
MCQLTLRILDQLAERLKQAARESGSRVNSYATSLLAAGVEPEWRAMKLPAFASAWHGPASSRRQVIP